MKFEYTPSAPWSDNYPAFVTTHELTSGVGTVYVGFERDFYTYSGFGRSEIHYSVVLYVHRPGDDHDDWSKEGTLNGDGSMEAFAFALDAIMAFEGFAVTGPYAPGTEIKIIMGAATHKLMRIYRRTFMPLGYSTSKEVEEEYEVEWDDNPDNPEFWWEDNNWIFELEKTVKEGNE